MPRQLLIDCRPARRRVPRRAAAWNWFFKTGCDR